MLECLDRGSNPAPLNETELLQQRLTERESQIIILEADLIKGNTKISNLEEQVATWREKYERLYDSHKRVQRLNQNLEDKLLQMVDKVKDEKSQLTKDIATLSIRLAESKHTYSTLQKENERYKNDMNLAIQLLQCKPDNFVSQKLDNLSSDTQSRVSQYIMAKSKPANLTNSKNTNDNDNIDTSDYEFNISASLMTRILAESIQDTVTKHCDSCTCSIGQNKPFAYNDDHYTVSTQTDLSGDMKNSFCLNCNEDIKHSCQVGPDNAAAQNFHIVKDRHAYNLSRPMYIIPQPSNPNNDGKLAQNLVKTFRPYDAETYKNYEVTVQDKIINKIGEDLSELKMNSGIKTDPALHHKLCDRTFISTQKTSEVSSGHGQLYVKDVSPLVNAGINDSAENISLQKSSQGSMGAASRASSFARSTGSANKSNTHVGPGPRFCSLRMQAGSKNILLDNAQPDVPPVLYKRQARYTDDLLLKEINDVYDPLAEKQNEAITEIAETHTHFINAPKTDGISETTLIDVQEGVVPNEKLKPHAMNPVLMNVSSSPLEPLKNHSLTSSNENNDNKGKNIKNNQTIADVDKMLTKPSSEIVSSEDKTKEKHQNETSDANVLKIFNFDSYEQLNKGHMQLNKSAVRMNFHKIENTKISKDSPPKSDGAAISSKNESGLQTLGSAVVNVYPNLTQTHLKVNETKRTFTNELSSSSLSSENSAVILQKQQLIRVAEWVEKNLEQQNNLNDVSSIEEDMNYNPDSLKTDISNETKQALKMPHPVSKYSKPSNSKESGDEDTSQRKCAVIINNVVKETIFPVECGEDYEGKGRVNVEGDTQAASGNGEREGKLSREELARMEYNVKQFLLNGPYWVKPQDDSDKSGRTSSKTETNV